jgi:acetyl-CoA/propionyl-CoA carboxylase biotin carboxyl carrier protein
VRLDSGVVSGSTVPGVFDSLVAKLIVTGATRDEALRRARRALKEFRIEGVATVLPFHRAAIDTADFIGTDGFKVHTRWIETDFAAMPDAMARPEPTEDPTLVRTHLEIEGKRVSLALPSVLLAGLGAAGQGAASAAGKGGRPAEDGIAAPVSGTLQAFKIADGATVAEGDLVAVMEAMKMETQVLAPKAGRLRLRVKEGDYLQAGDTLMVFEG